MSNKVRIVPAGMENDEDDIYDPITKTCQNMKITVVPDITIKAGLNDSNFDATLSDDVEKWFNSYRDMWNIYKKTPAMVETLRTFYLNTENPLLIALKLFANCPGCSNTKNKTLPCLILETVSEVKNQKPEILDQCDENMKVVAFNFVKTQGLPNLYKVVANAYDLQKNKNLFEEKLKAMISEHNYKDACHWAIILGLTERFGIFDLVFPLILQDKISLAEEYLDIEKPLRRPTIELLDSLLDRSSSVLNKCDEYIGMYRYPDVKIEKLQSKPLMKLIVRLSKKYNLPIETTPNVAHSRSYGYLQYLIHKRYVEKSLNNDSWRELVIDTLSSYIMNSKEMQLDLITTISYNNDMFEAVYWVKYFNLQIDELPSLVRDHMINQENQDQNIMKDDIDGHHMLQHFRKSTEKLYHQENEKEKREELWNNIDNSNTKIEEHNKQNYRSKQQLQQHHSYHHHHQHQHEQQQQQQQHQKDKFYRLKLDYNRIILIENSENFQLMLNELKNETLIAFDSEWKPSFQFQFSISILQLAKYDKIFLIDAQSKHITDELWSKLGKEIFNNLEIIKIGFALNQDLVMCHKAIPSMNLSTQIQSCYLDLQELWKKLLNLSDFHFPYKSTTTNETLSHLAEICLGKKLDKSNQFSNWGKRPLRRDQIIYAALDAHCLLEIYDVICKELDGMGIEIDHVIDSLNAELKAKSHRTKKKNKAQQIPKVQNKDEDIPSGPNSKPVRVSDVKFVCDNMLEGLAKSLRKFGIDCFAISSEQRDYCVEIAIRECCYLLTKGYRYARFSQYLPRGYCYKVQSDNIDDQTFEVLNYFNVIITEYDVFSRCQICNCNEFLLATNKHLKYIKNEFENDARDENNGGSSSGGGNIGNKDGNSICDKNPKKDNNEQQKLTPPQRNCIMNKITSKSLRTGKTNKGALIQVGILTQNLLNQVENFYICEGCGKCYWDGSHWEKVVKGKLKDVIKN